MNEEAIAYFDGDAEKVLKSRVGSETDFINIEYLAATLDYKTTKKDELNPQEYNKRVADLTHALVKSAKEKHGVEIANHPLETNGMKALAGTSFARTLEMRCSI